jgi:hypothetical protein
MRLAACNEQYASVHLTTGRRFSYDPGVVSAETSVRHRYGTFHLAKPAFGGLAD